jgi:predicted permease
VASQHSLGLKSIAPIVRQLAVTPPLLATLAGIGFAAMGWTLPHAIAQTMEALGEMALPLGLLGVGGSLVSVRVGNSWPAPIGSALVKTMGGPLFAWGAARVVGLGAVETSLLMILAASPTAIVSYTMAVEMKGDEQLASMTIVVSVLTSLVALAACVALFPQ